MNRKRDLRALIVVFVVMVTSMLFGMAQQARALEPDDIYGMKQVQLADLSDDGRWLLYAIRTWDTAEATWRTEIFRRDLETDQELLLFTPEDRASGAVWRPGGWDIAYVRNGDEGATLWMMDGDGANRRQISAEAGAFGALHWSPDGTALTWIGSDAVGEYEGEPGLRVVADGIGYRHLGDGFREGRLAQLFVMDLANGRARRLVEGPYDVRSVSWSPDSRRLAYAAKAEVDLGLNLNEDLWIVGRDGGEPERLTTNPGIDREPRWFADDRLAYLRTEEPLWESAPKTVTVMDPGEGEAGGVQYHPGGLDDFFWKYDATGGRFHVLKAERGCLDLVRVEGDSHVRLTDGGYDFWSFKVGGDRAVMQGAGQTLPSGIFTVDLGGDGPSTPELVIDPNEEWRRQVELIEPERFEIEVEGRTIEGWFFKPIGLHEGERVPVVLSIHGGPQWMYGGYFLPEFHILPRYGFGVVIANPTGSMGYGTEFMSGVRFDWVDRPARELMACLDHAVELGWADPDRMAVMGGSYGGHLGAALTTQGDRFRAAALDRMFPEPVAFWGTTDEKWFPEWEFGGKPWEPEALEIYRRNSPWEKVDRVNTPTLVSHGMRDYRCLIAGAEMWFSALRSRGVPARLIRFETEGHGIRDPRNIVFYNEQVLDWFDRHVRGGDEPDEPAEVHPDHD